MLKLCSKSAGLQVDMTGIDAVQKVMEEFAPDTPKRRTLQERKAMLAKGKRWASNLAALGPVGLILPLFCRAHANQSARSQPMAVGVKFGTYV